MTLALVPVALVDCGGKGMPGMPGGMPGGCPADIASADAVMDANFGLQGELEGKVKAALAAGANLQELAAEVEGEVATACGNLAKDLGASDDDIKPQEDGPGKKAEAACNAAVKFVGEAKAKAKGTLKVDVVPPKCSASMSAMADCAASCDATIKPGEAKVECEGGEISGKCEGQCKGTCTVEAGAKCEGTCGGTCKGTCEANFSGKCDGNCQGKCDGKDTKGKCAGTCEGKCEGGGNGSCGGACKGECSASCTMNGKAECGGTCSGGCSVEIKEPKCSGNIKPPEMSAECKANCDAKVTGKVECVPARVTVNVAGAADAQAAAKLRSAIEANLPAILKVTLGMKGKLEGVADNVKASVEGASAAVKGGGAAALKVAGCFAASLQAQAKASASINVSVKASASASAEAGAGG
ncbi:MAG TPA: hypothetical protein VI072_09540 [Polyangiaceae bacterium]